MVIIGWIVIIIMIMIKMILLYILLYRMLSCFLHVRGQNIHSMCKLHISNTDRNTETCLMKSDNSAKTNQPTIRAILKYCVAGVLFVFIL